MFYQLLLKHGKYHFCIMSERTLPYRTDNFLAKFSKSQKWEREAQSAEMHICKMKTLYDGIQRCHPITSQNG